VRTLAQTQTHTHTQTQARLEAQGLVRQVAHAHGQQQELRRELERERVRRQQEKAFQNSLRVQLEDQVRALALPASAPALKSQHLAAVSHSNGQHRIDSITTHQMQSSHSNGLCVCVCV